MCIYCACMHACSHVYIRTSPHVRETRRHAVVTAFGTTKECDCRSSRFDDDADESEASSRWSHLSALHSILVSLLEHVGKD